jgi:hypothetical protein
MSATFGATGLGQTAAKRQVYYRMLSKRTMMVVYVVQAIGLLDSSARAEGEAPCRAYAQKAVDAFHENESLGRCFNLGGRWQPNFDAHFNWCRGAPAMAVQTETAVRENQLRVCRKEPKAVDCNRYAIGADASQGSNLSGRCGFTGARWMNNYDAHLSWCLSAPIQAASLENNIRFAMLGVCGHQQEPFVRCDGYARHAVALVTEATSRRCGFGGNRWTPVYEEHLSWCIGVPANIADSETREREGPLSQCRTTHPLGPPPPPPEACAVSVVVTNRNCLNLDGTPSSIVPGSLSQPGCGGDQNTASQRAMSAFSSGIACVSNGDSPSPGCCTVSAQVTQGCLCR